MPLPSSFAGQVGAIPVTAALPFTVPANMVIHAIVPHPSATIKAVAIAGYTHYTSDRTAGGGNRDILNSVYGAYSSIVVASGTVDVYLLPIGQA